MKLKLDISHPRSKAERLALLMRGMEIMAMILLVVLIALSAYFVRDTLERASMTGNGGVASITELDTGAIADLDGWIKKKAASPASARKSSDPFSNLLPAAQPPSGGGSEIGPQQ